MTTRWSKGRFSERHRALMMWTLLCAGGASFAVLVQTFSGAVS